MFGSENKERQKCLNLFYQINIEEIEDNRISKNRKIGKKTIKFDLELI